MTTNPWILLEFRHTVKKPRANTQTGKSLQEDKGQEQPAELTHSKHTPTNMPDAACSHELYSLTLSSVHNFFSTVWCPGRTNDCTQVTASRSSKGSTAYCAFRNA